MGHHVHGYMHYRPGVTYCSYHEVIRFLLFSTSSFLQLMLLQSPTMNYAIYEITDLFHWLLGLRYYICPPSVLVCIPDVQSEFL